MRWGGSDILDIMRSQFLYCATRTIRLVHCNTGRDAHFLSLKVYERHETRVCQSCDDVLIKFSQFSSHFLSHLVSYRITSGGWLTFWSHAQKKVKWRCKKLIFKTFFLHHAESGSLIVPLVEDFFLSPHFLERCLEDFFRKCHFRVELRKKFSNLTHFGAFLFSSVLPHFLASPFYYCFVYNTKLQQSAKLAVSGWLRNFKILNATCGVDHGKKARKASRLSGKVWKPSECIAIFFQNLIQDFCSEKTRKLDLQILILFFWRSDPLTGFSVFCLLQVSISLAQCLDCNTQ